MIEFVNDPKSERYFAADKSQADRICGGKVSESMNIVRLNIYAIRDLGDPGISIGAKEPFNL